MKVDLFKVRQRLLHISTSFTGDILLDQN